MGPAASGRWTLAEGRAMPATDVTVPRDEWRDRARARATSLVPPLRSPRTRSDLVQILKAVLAAVLAWYVAAHQLGLTESFMAPWTAMLTVHATVYRSFTRGGQVVPLRVRAVLDGVREVAPVEVRVGAVDELCLVPHEGVDAERGLPVELHQARLPRLVDEPEGVDT